MKHLHAAWKILQNLKNVCCIQILYFELKNFVKDPSSSQIYMQNVKTCKKRQATYENLSNFNASSTREVPKAPFIKLMGMEKNCNKNPNAAVEFFF